MDKLIHYWPQLLLIPAFWCFYRIGHYRGFYSTRVSILIGNDRWWGWACSVRKKMGRRVDLTKER